MRDLIQLVQTAISKMDTLPIAKKAVVRSIDELRSVYKRTVEEPQWQYLLEVYRSKNIKNDNYHRSLLFSRCLLEYKYILPSGNEEPWYDIHPVIKDLPEFQSLLSK